MTDALSVIKGFEGYIDHAKWDKTAYRAGYGSDTTTLEDGRVVPITADSVVNRADSERDLARRSAEFEKTAAGQVGADKWASLPEQARAGLTSMTYNYGSLPHDVVAAAQTGDVNAIASSVRGRGGDNEGINKGRRDQEADIILGGGGPVSHADVDYASNVEVPLHENQAVAGVPRVPDKPDDSPGWWQTEKDAFNQNSTIALILNSNPYKADPSWQKPDENKLATDLEKANLDPERYAKFLGGSTSEAGYMKSIQDAQEDRDRLERLSRAGLKGTALDFVNQALDPVNILTDIGVSMVAPELTLGKYGVRTGRILSAALAGGASGLATTALNYGFNPNATKADLMMGTVLGAGLGGIVGRLHGNPLTAREAAKAQEIGQRAIADHEGVPFVPRRGAGSAGAASIGNRSRLADLPIDENDPTSSFANIDMLEHNDVARSAMAKYRGDIAARGDRSKNPGTRGLMGALVQDGVGKIGDSLNGEAASETKALLAQGWLGEFARTWHPQKKSFIAKGGTEDQFDDQVYRYINDKSVTRDDKLEEGGRYAEEVIKSGQMLRKLYKDQLANSKNPFHRDELTGRGVDGATETNPSEHYLPREWATELVHMADQHFEKGTVQNVLKGAIREANPDIEEGTLEALGNAMHHTLTSAGAGMDSRDMLARISSGDLEEAMAALVDNGSLKQAQATEILKNMNAKKLANKSDASHAQPFKRRTLLSVTYKLPYRPLVEATGVEHDADFGVMDLLNKNVEYLTHKYTDRTAGNIALARVKLRIGDKLDEAGNVIGDGFNIVDGITNDREFEKLVEYNRAKGLSSGQTRAEMDVDEKRLRYVYDSIKGRKRYEFNNTNAGWALRMARKYNFIRMMNQVGLAQLPELGNLVGSVGLKAMVQQMPNMRRIVGEDGIAHLKNTFGDDVEHVFGNGLEGWTRTPSERHDQLMDVIRSTSGGTWADKTQRLLDKGSRITAKISGMEGIDTMSKRWAYKGVIQKFANVAAGRAKMTGKRLADLGIDPKMHERINAELLRPEGVQMNGSRVAGLKLDKWKDREAAEVFRRAVYRKSSEIIQKNDLGNMIMWMGHPIAQTLMQFRSFMAASYVKQSMKALHMRDFEALTNASMAMFIGSMVYEVQTREQAIGRSDKDKFLEDRLKWDKIVGAGFAKAGVSSILPMLVDTALPAMGYKQQFAYSRTTGQPSDLWFGNPGTGLINDAINAAGASRGLFHGDLSQEEERAMNKLLPFNNAFGYMQFHNFGISGLQQRTPRSRKKLVGLFGD